MLRLRPILRCVSTSSVIFSSASMATEPIKVEKSALKELRTRTGYSYVNCRKAILEFGNDRLDEAEKWLRELAEKEGWKKAAKLSKRQTKHGLVSAIAEGSRAALVEINCETDFVARGDQFRELVEKVSLASLKSAKTFDPLPGEKISLVFKDFDSLELLDGTSAREALNATINKLGENMIVPPVTLIVSQPGVSLWGYTHPPGGSERVQMGMFAAVVGLEREKEDAFPLEKLGRQICQHIIGMKSETLGEPPEKSTSAAEGQEKDEVKTSSSEAEESGEVTTTQIDDKETCLLRQAFLLNPSQTVFDYVTGHGVKVIDFHRAEIGEKSDEQK